MMMMMMTFLMKEDLSGIFAFVIHILPPEKPSSNALLSNHTHDVDTQHVPGVLPSSSRGENGGIIINIIASSFLAVPSARHFRTRKSDSVLSRRVRATPPEEDLSAKEILEQVKETTTTTKKNNNNNNRRQADSTDFMATFSHPTIWLERRQLGSVC